MEAALDRSSYFYEEFGKNYQEKKTLGISRTFIIPPCVSI